MDSVSQRGAVRVMASYERGAEDMAGCCFIGRARITLEVDDVCERFARPVDPSTAREARLRRLDGERLSESETGM